VSVQVSVVEKAGSNAIKAAARVEEIVGVGFELKRLAENFDVLTEAAGGTVRLRGFVLDLATRGRLVRQLPIDGVARELLTKITREAKGAQHRMDESKPFELPASWCWTTIGSVCSYIQRGKSPRYVESSSVPVVSQKCVRWEGFLIDRARFIDPASLDTYAVERFLQEGDLLWNSTGHGTVGRIAVFRRDDRYPRVVADSHVTVLRPEVDPRYLWCWIASPTVQATIDDLVSGTTKQTELATSTVAAHPLPLPPLAEQKRIVARVDQLMALIDDLDARQTKKLEVTARFTKASLAALTTAERPEEFDAAWKRVVENLPTVIDRAGKVGELRGAVFGLACRGALTKRGDGSGADVVRLIAQRCQDSSQGESHHRSREADRHRRKLANQQKLSGELGLPSNWVWASLLACCRQLVDCHNKTAPYTTDGVPLVRTSNIRDGKINLDGVRYVSEETYRRWSQRCPPEPGDALFTREAPMGEVGLVEPGMRVCMGQRTMLLRTFPDLIDPRFLLVALRDPAFQRRMIRAAVGSTVKHLRVGDVEALVIPVPPPEEQKRIVAKVEHLLKLCDDLEAKLRRAEDRASKLVEAVVQEVVA
jgi:type I restriction enzyme, S subunit